MSKIGVYPGSFNPPTGAHVAIATAAIRAHDLAALDLVVSRIPLGKENRGQPSLDDRLTVLRASFQRFSQIKIRLTEQQLLSEISQGYDVLVLGGDKWAQLQDLRWYDSAEHRDLSLARLPQLAIAARSNVALPGDTQLPLEPELVSNISSTAARAGATQMMTSEALCFAKLSGAWLEPGRYELWQAEQGSRESG